MQLFRCYISTEDENFLASIILYTLYTLHSVSTKSKNSNNSRKRTVKKESEEKFVFVILCFSVLRRGSKLCISGKGDHMSAN